MLDLPARAKHIALLRLDEAPGGLCRAEWLVDAVEMILAMECTGIDVEVILAAAWASGTIGASHWLDSSDGYQVEDVHRDLGEQVARIVSWTSPDECQDHDEHLRDLAQAGPVEARVIALGQVMVDATLSHCGFTERHVERLMRLAMSVPALLPRVAAGWSVPVEEGEA